MLHYLTKVAFTQTDVQGTLFLHFDSAKGTGGASNALLC